MHHRRLEALPLAALLLALTGSGCHAPHAVMLPPDGMMMPPPDGGGMAATCATNADCTYACPMGSIGCTCASTPMGMVCVPTCDVSADCPMTPSGALQCDTSMHRCVGAMGDGGMMPPPDGAMMMPPPDGAMPPPPDGAMMAPTPCTTSSECTGHCPPGAHGCACTNTPMGMVCVPTCTTATDCPPGPMGQTLLCRSGVCAP